MGQLRLIFSTVQKQMCYNDVIITQQGAMMHGF